MNLLSDAKWARENRAKFSEMEATIAAQAKELETLRVSAGDITEIAAENEKLSVKVGKLEASIKTLSTDLATEKAAHVATSKSVNSIASAQALTIVGASGAPAVTSTAQAGNEDILNRYNAITDPQARTAFYRKHKAEIQSAKPSLN